MIENYIKTAWKNIRKNISFSFINIFGLALGISLCLVLITILKDQFGYDRFHEHAERIYRINTEAIRKNGDSEKYASVPFPLSTELKSNYTFVEKMVRLTSGLNGAVSSGEKELQLNGFFTDPEFFDVFGFRLLYGESESALKDPNGIVLTEKIAQNFFGNTDPVGKILRINNEDSYTVTGVIQTPSGKTHLEFDMLASNKLLSVFEKKDPMYAIVDNWKNYYSSYIYFLAKEGAGKSQIESALENISSKQYSSLELESRDKAYHFYLQPLNKIVPGPMLSNNMGNALPSQLLWAISALALVVLISAAFNYNNLSLARSLSRAKEIGIRKSIGATRRQLIFQFLTEAVLTAMFAFVFAGLIFHFFLRPLFEGFSIFQYFNIILNEDIFLYGAFMIFCIVVGLVAGIFPAFYLSAFKTSEVLKDLKSNVKNPKFSLRKVLLVTQFVAALLFLVTLINIYREISYVMNADYGFQKDNIVNVELQGNDYTKVRQAFSQNSSALKVSGISHAMATSRDRSIDVRINSTDDKFSVRDYTIDENYIDNVGLHLLAGKNFTANLPADHELFVVVNENFLQRFKLGNPAAAIGKTVLLDDSIKVSILGVLNDFQFKPFTYAMEPLLLRYNPAEITQLNIRISGKNNIASIASLTRTWKSIDKSKAFNYHFFSDSIRDEYKPFLDMTNILGLISFMAIAVACLGFLGLIVFLAKQRVKEVSIRKILGASVAQIAFLLSKSFLRMLIIACAVGLPISIIINNLMLQEFSYKINPVIGYVGGVLLIFLIALMTIGTQLIKTATANPVKSLKVE